MYRKKLRWKNNRKEELSNFDNTNSIKFVTVKKMIVAIGVGVLVFASGCSNPEPGAIDEHLVDHGQSQDTFHNTDAETVVGDDNLIVKFLDVGQGNCVLVEYDGQYMLIDGGDYDYSSYVVQYLKNQGIESLEYVIVSHYDSDHLSGCVGVLRNFDCELVICPDYEGDTKTYDTFVSDMDKYDLEYYYPQVGETYEFGDAMFTIVCPEEYDYDDENDNSVGVRLVYGSNSFLICGDAGEESEEDMLESGVYLKSDVYMVNHHGSGGSSISAFVQAVDPEYLVISCGYDNSYGHPAKAMMNRLQKTGADLFRTDLQGEIVAISDGTNITWNVKPSNDFRCGEDVVEDGQVDKPYNDGSNGVSANYAGTSNNTGNSESENINSAEKTFILNTNSGKFHLLTCESVIEMKPENKKEMISTISQMESQGYSPCKSCLD